MGRIAIFIDGAYFNYVLKEEFGSPKIDFSLLVKELAGGREVLRAYYYDCLPYQSANPTQQEKERFGRKQKFLDALDRLSRFQTRLGRLEFRGLKSDNSPIFEQKRVDILLGVDLVLLAAKHQITDAAILLAGDSDFLPAVQAAKPEGLVTHLFHGKSPHRDLVVECDERFQINQDFVNRIRMVGSPPSF